MTNTSEANALLLYPGYDSVTWWHCQRITQYDTFPLLRLAMVAPLLVLSGLLIPFTPAKILLLCPVSNAGSPCQRIN